MTTPKSTPEKKNKLYEKAFCLASNYNPDTPDFELKMIDSLFRKVKKSLCEDIPNQIKKVKPKELRPGKGILVIDKDYTRNYHLVEGIVFYIWYNTKLQSTTLKSQGYTSFVPLFHRQIRDTEESSFNKWIYSSEFINEFCNKGSVVFLDNLNNKKTLNCLAQLFREIRIKNFTPDEIPNTGGILIVSADSLPEDLKDQFEPIYLEPKKQEKQDKAVDIPQAKTGKDFVHFPTPVGTQWHEVKISFIDNENVKISTRYEIEPRHYSQMGFRKGKANKPVASWNVLIAFKEKNGCLTFSQANKSRIEKVIQDLRRRLKTYFGIQDDPIIFEGGYRPKFKVSIIEPQYRSVHAYSNSKLFDEKEDD